MDKKKLIIFISGGVVSLITIIFTIMVIINMQNKPLNICTTSLTYDLSTELLKGFCGIDEKNIKEYVYTKDVDEAYLELLNDKVDAVIISEIDDNTKEILNRKNVELESTVIAKDGLVFFNSIKNPVDSLTVKELKNIFSLKHSNWNEIGGNDEEIIAYPPAQKSEEEYMMKKFLGTSKLPTPKYRLQDDSLDGLVTAVSKYLDTREGAIAYTTFHNSKEIEDDGIRILSIGELLPTEEYLKGDRYPATMNIYVITKKDNSQTKKFAEYITSKAGRAVVEDCGYVSLVK